MRQQIDRITKNVLVFLMGILVVTVVWQVCTRYFLQSPSTFTDELSRFLLIWVSLLGAAYASGKEMHLAIDLLPSKLNKVNQQRLKILIHSLVLCFVISVMVVGGGMLVYLVWNQPSPSLDISMGYVYSVLPLSGLLIIYYKIYDLGYLLNFRPENKK